MPANQKLVRDIYLRACVFAFIGLFLCFPVRAQTRTGCNTITPDMNFTVHSVKIKGHYVPEDLQKKIEELVGINEPYNTDRTAAASKMVGDAIIAEEDKFIVSVAGATSVLYVITEVCDVSDSTHPRQAEISFRPLYLRVDLYNTGKNILPVVRTRYPSFYSHAPAFLLSAMPHFQFANDKRYGTFASIETNTDFLNLPQSKDKEKKNKLSLYLDVNARKSINNPFFDVNTNLELAEPVYTNKTIGWKAGVQYVRASEPLGNNNNQLQQVKLYAGIGGNLQSAFLHKYNVGSAVRFLKNDFQQATADKISTSEHAYELYAVTDGRLGQGFSRLGVWFDAATPQKKESFTSYRRIASRCGYSTSFGNTHNAVSLESMGTFGYSWGNIPVYNQFYAGNTFSNFLYTSLQSADMQTFPAEPIVRSLGEQEGGFKTPAGVTVGGTSFWNISINLSIPVRKWSVPLIPDIVINEETGSTARKVIKAQAYTASEFIESDLVDREGLSDDAAQEEADKIVETDIRPALNYLADRANVISVKPAVLFDVAGINKRSVNNLYWCAAGAGIQVNVVNARLDVGYMQTLSPSSYRLKGNFILRFVVENLF